MPGSKRSRTRRHAFPTRIVVALPMSVCQVKSIRVNVRTAAMATNPHTNPIVASICVVFLKSSPSRNVPKQSAVGERGDLQSEFDHRVLGIREKHRAADEENSPTEREDSRPADLAPFIQGASARRRLEEIEIGGRCERADRGGKGPHRRGKDTRDHQASDTRRKVLHDEFRKDFIRGGQSELLEGDTAIEGVQAQSEHEEEPELQQNERCIEHQGALAVPTCPAAQKPLHK